MAKYLDSSGLTQVWNKAKETFLTPGGGDERYFYASGPGTTVPTSYIDLDDYNSGNANYLNLKSGTYGIGRPGYSETLVVFRSSGSTSALELKTSYSDTANLYYRKTIDSNRVSGPWRVILSDANYTSYTVTKTGSGASGTWAINISGNAASASSVSWSNITSKPDTYSPSSHSHNNYLSFTIDTNYLAARFHDVDRAQKAVNTYIEFWQSWNGGSGWFNLMAGKFMTAGGSSSQFVKGDGTLDSNTYSTTSHNHDSTYLKLSGGSMTGTLNLVSVPGYAIKFNNSGSGHIGVTYGSLCLKIKNLDGEGNVITNPINLYLGSDENKVLHSGNYTDYTITKTGTGASGTWGISISGNAATAGTTIQVIGYTQEILVEGDSNTYYPVRIPTTGNKGTINTISVWRDLGGTSAVYSGNHPMNGDGVGGVSCWYEFVGRYNAWDGNGGYYYTRRAWYGYSNVCAHAAAPGGPVSELFIWLRGGGTNYKITTSYPATTASIYYARTNAASEQHPCWIEPRTDLGNQGILPKTYYGDITGNAASATTASAVAWSGVLSKPDTATRWPAWSEVTGKPSTFTPSSHTHSYLPLTGGTIANGGNWASISFNRTDVGSGSVGGIDGNGLYFAHRDTAGHEISMYLKYGVGLTVGGNSVIHSGNIGDQTVSYAYNSGALENATLANITCPISPRDFTVGTLIHTNINYSVSSGQAFYMEIKGDTYFSLGSMYTVVQGYIYNNTIISRSVTHLGVVKFSHLYAMLLDDGKLAFWFDRLGYWQSFSVRIYESSAGNYWKNQCTSITNEAKPNGTKEVDMCESTYFTWNNDNLTSFSSNEIDAIMV